MREYLDEALPNEFGDLLAVLGDVRARLKADGAIPAYEYWRDAIDPSLLEAVHAGRRDDAHRQLLAALTTPEAVASAGVVTHR